MPMNKYVIGIFVAVFLAGIGGFFFWNSYKLKQINSFEMCSKAGYPIMESYPAQCKTPDGRSFTQVIEQVQPSVICNGKNTVGVEEGPYYKVGSPKRNSLIEEEVVGTKLILTGYVFDANCKPITNAWLDFWQTDGKGVYDNKEYKLRGHQFTDNNGRYLLETVLPVRYSGRTPHIHVKVKAHEQASALTTQLFLPDVAQNKSDYIFNESLVMDVKDGGGFKEATFNFVIAR